MNNQNVDYLMYSVDLFFKTQESACGWPQSCKVIGLPETPLRTEMLNLSSFLTSFTPDSLTTHTWGRLKAALSIHKKTTGASEKHAH